MVNSPHLTPAYELDRAFLEFSSNISSFGLPTHINSLEDLNKIMEGAKAHVINKMKLWEFYVIDVQTTLEEVKKSLETNQPYDKEIFKDIDIASLSFKEQAQLLADKCVYESDQFGQRFYRKIKIDVARSFIERLIETEPIIEYTMETDETYIPTEEELWLHPDPEIKIEQESEKPRGIEEKRPEFKTSISLELITDQPTFVKRQRSKSIEQIKSESQIKPESSPEISRESKPKTDDSTKPSTTQSHKRVPSAGRRASDIKKDIKPRTRRVRVTLLLNEVKEKKLQALLNEVNLPYYGQYDSDVTVILKNVKNRAIYMRLDDKGPKQGEINRE